MVALPTGAFPSSSGFTHGLGGSENAGLNCGLLKVEEIVYI